MTLINLYIVYGIVFISNSSRFEKKEEDIFKKLKNICEEKKYL